MMMSLDAHITALAPEGLSINIWPCEGGFQANVKERGGNGWTCHTDRDPIYALIEALRQRRHGVASRRVEGDPQPEQIDIEQAIEGGKPPKKNGHRALFYHPESDSLTEIEGSVAWGDLDPMLEDVTDIPEFEERFKAEQTAKITTTTNTFDELFA